jgi:membrane protease YdiL (CAAX protease family)
MSWRFILLSVSSLFIYGIIRREEWSLKEMGIRHDNLKKALPFYLVFTILGIVILLLIKDLAELPKITDKAFIIKTWVFFLPISFFQEFAFRSFLIPRLKSVFHNKYTIIFINAILFTFLHIIYPNMAVVLPLIFVSGLLFAWLYLKYPNLVLISISHSILNILAMLLGFFLIS